MNANMNQTANTSLVDPFGRTVTYLRLSVTDRCNLRCVYCMAEDMTFLHKKEVLSIEELQEVSAAFVELGVKKIRLTGGEPLVRNGVDQLITGLGSLEGLDELTMTSNGVLLEKYLPSMLEAGIKRVNISLDSLDRETFAKLARADQLPQVLTGLEAVKNSGIKVRLNSVIMSGENNDSVLPLIDYSVENGFDIAFIEEMPLGHISSHQRADTVTMNDVITEKIAEKYELVQPQETFALNAGPARYATIKGTQSRIGFISPHSNNFCGSCNRVRVTVEGQLLLCLGNEDAVDLRAVLRREDYSRDQLKSAILEGIQRKPEKHDFNVGTTHIVRFMSMTGG